MSQYGIIGKPLNHSHSPEFFNKKFEKEGLQDHAYSKYELDSIDDFPELLEKNPEIKGLNVTSPYKESVLKYVHEVNKDAKFIGAVNVLKILQTEEGRKITGYNTDAYGFETSLLPYIEGKKLQALIFGTGGGSKAVEYVLKKIGITHEVVTRRPLKANQIIYWAINKSVMEEYKLLINATPLGMFPNEEEAPPIPFEYITKDHIVYDLVYNPEETRLLEICKEAEATVINGKEMFRLQAEKTWDIWNTERY